jgi:tRNA/tmRNA/rRNA uracil-C5-methylase (TrmA/RlmC/RlmD family)
MQSIHRLSISFLPSFCLSFLSLQLVLIVRYVVDDDIVLTYSPNLFVQSNFEMNKELVKFIAAKIASLLQSGADVVNGNQKRATTSSKRKKQVLELFSGNGNFTLALLKRGFDVVAVEGEQYLCHLLKQNLKDNIYLTQNGASKSTENDQRIALSNLHRNDHSKEAKKKPWGYLSIEHAHVLTFLRDKQKDIARSTGRNNSASPNPNATSYPSQRLPYDCLLLDPPRSGLGSSAAKLLTPSLTRVVVYVSCDAESLSQDLRILVKNGFQIQEQILIDMFPQTSHFETVTILLPEALPVG